MFDTILNGTMTLPIFLITIFTALLLGVIVAFVHIKTTKYNKNFAISLAILPVLVSVIIMMVNGNLGTSVAILGAFGLVRFRSLPGSAREIVSIFFVMTIGLVVGTGYIAFAIMVTLLLALVLFLLSKINFGGGNDKVRILKITIPENLQYQTIFDDIFCKYVDKIQLNRVKTTNMGSLFELEYQLTLKNDQEKELIDEIRCRNGNLKIILERPLIEGEL